MLQIFKKAFLLTSTCVFGGELLDMEGENAEELNIIHKECLESSFKTAGQFGGSSFSNHDFLVGPNGRDSLRLQAVSINTDKNGKLIGIQFTLQTNPY